MKDLSNLNDLYNAQDVIILCEIVENRFLNVFGKTTYNSRKCNLASKLRGCIQREQSKITLALLTNNSVMEISKKTLTGDLSCVNAWLSFDT